MSLDALAKWRLSGVSHAPTLTRRPARMASKTVASVAYSAPPPSAVRRQRGPAFVEPYRQGAVIVADALAQVQVRKLVRQQCGQPVLFAAIEIGRQDEAVVGHDGGGQFGGHHITLEAGIAAAHIDARRAGERQVVCGLDPRDGGRQCGGHARAVGCIAGLDPDA
ncbi:MAG: hypothetical protein ACYCY9_11490 [Thiobacillus sp.]